jgi:hypothetical protein
MCMFLDRKLSNNKLSAQEKCHSIPTLWSPTVSLERLFCTATAHTRRQADWMLIDDELPRGSFALPPGVLTSAHKETRRRISEPPVCQRKTARFLQCVWYVAPLLSGYLDLRTSYCFPVNTVRLYSFTRTLQQEQGGNISCLQKSTRSLSGQWSALPS